MKVFSVLLAAATIFFIQGCEKKNNTVNNNPDANFSVSGYEIAAPSPITFINTSVNATSYFWNFGDGTTSTSSNPVHTYNVGGTYLLKLRVTGPTGTDSICKLLSIATPPPANKSEFSYFFDKMRLVKIFILNFSINTICFKINIHGHTHHPLPAGIMGAH